jgi:hypothetical protein
MRPPIGGDQGGRSPGSMPGVFALAQSGQGVAATSRLSVRACVAVFGTTRRPQRLIQPDRRNRTGYSARRRPHNRRRHPCIQTPRSIDADNPEPRTFVTLVDPTP